MKVKPFVQLGSFQNAPGLIDDKYNERLLGALQPPAYQNPTPKHDYHLVVIGGDRLEW